jgi:hypothetical protein
MNPALIAMLLSAVMAFGGAWKIQDWRYAAKEVDRVQAQQIAEQAARSTELRRGNIASAALASAEARAVALGRTAAALSTERAGLLAQLDITTQFTPSNTATACPDTAHTLADLLGQCTGRYSEVAAAADRHASDAQKLSDAWPF